jgi:hypothetical protein
METGEAKKNPAPPVPLLLPPPPLSTAGAFPPLCLPSAPFLPSVPGRIRALAICRSQSLLQSRLARPRRIPHRWARPQPSLPLVGRDERCQACFPSSVDERAGSTPSPSRASSTPLPHGGARTPPATSDERPPPQLGPLSRTAGCLRGERRCNLVYEPR